jgi:uncharacterized protein YndB with AHSA1/START domain
MLRKVTVVDSISIEREIFINAVPDTVFEVVSDPVHVARWWPDEAHYEAVAGSTGEIVFASPDGDKVETFEVLEVTAPRTFTFRWTQPAGTPARRGNSFLVTFECLPRDDGTLLRMTETGFDERGWTADVVDAAYRDHTAGWDHFLPRIAPYLAGFVPSAG